jgi:hypothetical protein
VLVELKLEQFIKAGLALYRANPFLTSTVFYDAGHAGHPTVVLPSALIDEEKLWLPEEYVGGTLRYGSDLFPILSNTEHQLTVDGDPSQSQDPDNIGYLIIPPAASKLQELLEKQSCTVTTAYPQIPIQSPIFSIRLEKDTQGPTYVGESIERWAVDGVEFAANRMTMAGNYLVSIWSDNRLACLWLYAWLLHYVLLSQQQFATWGLSDVSVGGSDLDPATPMLPEHVYVRHLLFTATREERAVNTRDVEWVSALCLKIFAQYARIDTFFPQPLP